MGIWLQTLWDSALTGILHRRNHQLETVRIRSPAVGHVLQSHEVRARQERVDGVLCVPTGDVNLEVEQPQISISPSITLTRIQFFNRLTPEISN